MMNINEFEKQAKEVLSTSRSDVDLDNLLIDLHLKKKTYKAFYVPIIIASLLLLVFSGFVYNTWTSTDVVSVKEIKSQLLVTEIDETEKQNEYQETLSQTEEGTEANAINISKNEIVKEGESFKVESELGQEIKSSVKKSIEKISSISVAKETKKSVRISGQQLSPNVFESKVNKDVVVRSNSSQSFSTQASSDSDLEIKSMKDLTLESSSRMISNFESLSLVPSLLTERTTLFNKKAQDCPSFKPRTWFLALVPEIGYEHQFKSLSAASNTFSSLLNDRLENEKTLEGLQAGLSLMVYNTKGLYFKGGLSYSVFTERMQLDTTYTEMDTTIGIVSITESQGGDTLTVIYGDIISTTTYNERKTVHHSFKMIDIPFAIGQSFNFNGHGIDAEIGVILNIRTSTKGRVYEGVDNFVDVENKPLFQTSLGLGYFGSVYYRKDLSNGSSLFVGPRFKVRPKKYSLDSNPVTQRYTSVGLHAGYIFRF